MRKLENYNILDIDYTSPLFVPEVNPETIDGLSTPNYEFVMIASSRFKLEKAKKQLELIKSNTQFVNLYNSVDHKVDKQTFQMFLEKYGSQVKLTPLLIDEFDDDPFLKHLIVNKDVSDLLDSELSPLEKGLHKNFYSDYKIISNLISHELFNALSICSENSNLIDILKSKHQLNQIFKIYEASKTKKVKASVSPSKQTSLVPISTLIKRNSELLLLNENLDKLKLLKDRSGFNLSISDKKVAINLRVSGGRAKFLLEFMTKYFESVNTTNDYFAESTQEINATKFVSKWIPIILTFCEDYKVKYNRKGGYSEDHLLAVSTMLKHHNLLQERFIKNDDYGPFRKWIKEILHNSSTIN